MTLLLTTAVFDRVYASMMLHTGRKANALGMLIKAEHSIRRVDFLRLANALVTLYPYSIEEKRLLNAMLLAVSK